MATMNCDRQIIYDDMFRSLVGGDCVADEATENMRANLLVDVRWPEVAKAFADCLLFQATGDEPIRPLAADFERLVGRAATIAFGSSRHDDIPSWFLQNYEGFLASTLHKILQHCDSELPVFHKRWVQLALLALVDVAEGLRSYVGLSYLSQSTGAHVLMCAVANAKYDFIAEEIKHNDYGHQTLADVLAQELLVDPNHALEAQSAFCFFARSERWRAFANRCVHTYPSPKARPLRRLLEEVSKATKAGERKDEATPGLFFLASAFLDADSSPEAPSRVAKPTSTLSRSPQSIISKRSLPFVRLVRRLVSDP